MRGLVLLLVVSAALASPQGGVRPTTGLASPQGGTRPTTASPQGGTRPRPQEGTRPSGDTAQSTACNDLLKSVEERVANKTAVDKCISEQPGLQATLDKLKASSTGSGPQSGFPTVLLAEAGLSVEALTLRKCISRENKQLITTADGSQVFDVTKFKSELAATVAGTSSEAKTTLGLNSCPVTLLNDYEVFKYMVCIKSYCATGAAPKN